jgi:S-adenosylmethionine-dependent methyltransferase
VQDDTGSAGVFDTHLAAWRRWQQEPWGRMRYALVADLLDRHLPASPCRVLDVGGGDGADVVRLAERGDLVTVVDQSDSMLARPAGLATVTAGLRDLGSQGLPPADVVLCHNVVQYEPDLDAAVGAVVAAARPGGLVSLLATNPVHHVLRTVVRGLDPAAALDVLDAATFPTATFDHEVARITWQQALESLQRNGCELLARYGVQCVNHLVTADERKHEPQFAADLQRLELALADRDPYRDVAAFWMLVVRRAG